MRFNIFKRQSEGQPASPAVLPEASSPLDEFYRLRKLWATFPRYTPVQVEFLKYTITAVDCASFLAQYKEIFVDEQYRFEHLGGTPLIIDCGANIGMSCLYFKSLFPEGQVIALEADEGICEVLRTNLTKHGLVDVEVLNKAVWTDDQGVAFAADGADGGSIFGGGRSHRIPSVRLRSILQEHSEIDLLKIDIEGAEHAVLMDSSEELRKVRHLFFEYHSWASDEQRLDDLLRLLREKHFRYHITHITPHSSPFVNRGQGEGMDLQLNVFAYRVK